MKNFNTKTATMIARISAKLILVSILTVPLLCDSLFSKAQSDCFVSIQWYPSTTNPLEIHFCSTGFFEPGSYTYTPTWDFGDGNTSTDSCVVHTYSSPGTYTICFLASMCIPNQGGLCCSDDTCMTVTIGALGMQDINGNFQMAFLPNPFVNNLTIMYEVNKESQVSIELLDLHSKRVAVIENVQKKSPGSYKINWTSVEALPAGIYFIHASLNGTQVRNKMIKIN